MDVGMHSNGVPQQLGDPQGRYSSATAIRGCSPCSYPRLLKLDGFTVFLHRDLQHSMGLSVPAAISLLFVLPALMLSDDAFHIVR